MWWSHLKLWLIIHWLSVWGIGRLYVWQNYIGQSTEVHLICTFAPYWAKICRRSIWTIPSPRISCALSQQHTSVEIVIKPCRTFQVGLTTEDCLWYICTKLINNLYWINIKKTYELIKNFLLMTLYSVCEQTKGTKSRLPLQLKFGPNPRWQSRVHWTYVKLAMHDDPIFCLCFS